MALCLQRLKKDGEIMKYCAALEVEEPSTFTEALDMAIDIDDYELISSSEREYGRQALRRMGANDEVLEAIEGLQRPMDGGGDGTAHTAHDVI